MQVAEKWDDQMAPGSPDSDAWRQRARRAEAEREAAQTIAYSAGSTLEAQLAPLERRLAGITGSRSWRLTHPLRELNLWRRKRSPRRGGER